MADQQTVSAKDKQIASHAQAPKTKTDADQANSATEDLKRSTQKEKKEKKEETTDVKPVAFENNEDEKQFTLDELHTNLIIISKIPAGYKLSVSGRTLAIDNTYIQSVTRWVYGDDRLKSIAFIRDIVSQTFTKINEIKILC